MGSSLVFAMNDAINLIQELTFLSREEICRALHKFQACHTTSTALDLSVRLPKLHIVNIPELKVNPYAERICDIFSSKKDGMLSFEDFLDMMSCFSEQASRDVKVDYAFRIFDFDNDDFISKDDLMQIIKLLTFPNKLSDEMMELIIQNVLTESDLDNDDMLSFAEFQHLMSKSPDFVNMFRIRL